jgi:hypothetical protein
VDIVLWPKVHYDLLSAAQRLVSANSWWGSRDNPERLDPPATVKWRKGQVEYFADEVLHYFIKVIPKEKLVQMVEKAHEDWLVHSMHTEE